MSSLSGSLIVLVSSYFTIYSFIPQDRDRVREHNSPATKIAPEDGNLCSLENWKVCGSIIILTPGFEVFYNISLLKDSFAVPSSTSRNLCQLMAKDFGIELCLIYQGFSYFLISV